MIKLNINQSIRDYLKKGSISKQLNEILLASDFIVIADYKKETPVDKGPLRQSVARIKKSNSSYIISAPAKTRGKMYGVFIHQGTGKYKNSNMDVGRISRVRAYKSIFANKGKSKKKKLKSKNDMALMFAGMRKRGVKMSIKPNKFALRARNSAEKKVNSFIIKELKKIL